jgi:hypothetical protein
MRGQLSFLAVEDNLPRLQFGEGATLDGNHIAGPESRQHAGPGDPQAHLAGGASDFVHQLAAYCATLCVFSMGGRNLRGLPVVLAGPLGTLHLAAGQRQRLEDVLAAHVRLLVVLLDDVLASRR